MREGKREVGTVGFTVTVLKQLTGYGNNRVKGYFFLFLSRPFNKTVVIF